MYLIPTEVIDWLKELAEDTSRHSDTDGFIVKQFARHILNRCNIEYNKGEEKK